jgi:D-tyrosyl-tRNA(Tyr) deacylase
MRTKFANKYAIGSVWTEEEDVIIEDLLQLTEIAKEMIIQKKQIASELKEIRKEMEEKKKILFTHNRTRKSIGYRMFCLKIESVE